MQHKYPNIYEKDFSLFAEDIGAERSLDIAVRIPTDQDHTSLAK